MDIGIITNCITVTTADEEVSYWVRYSSISVEEEIVDEYYSACHVTDENHLAPALFVCRPYDLLPPAIGRSGFGMYNMLSIVQITVQLLNK